METYAYVSESYWWFHGAVGRLARYLWITFWTGWLAIGVVLVTASSLVIDLCSFSAFSVVPFVLWAPSLCFLFKTVLFHSHILRIFVSSGFFHIPETILRAIVWPVMCVSGLIHSVLVARCASGDESYTFLARATILLTFRQAYFSAVLLVLRLRSLVRTLLWAQKVVSFLHH